MNKDKLHEKICELLDLLDDHCVDISNFESRWCFITDINTNEIRDGWIDEAIKLYGELESCYQNL